MNLHIGGQHKKIVKEAFALGVPPLSDIARNTSVLLTNTHYTLHGARPYVPNVVEVFTTRLGDFIFDL